VLRALSNTSVELQLNGHWVMEFAVFDDNYCLVTDPTIAVLVTRPSGGTLSPTATAINTGIYRASLQTDENGRWVSSVNVTNYGSIGYAAWVEGVSTNTDLPSLTDVKNYLSDGDPDSLPSVSDAQLQEALEAEAAAQRRVCNVGATYPVDLRQALLRRVARNLALRGLPIMVLQGDAETGSLVPPGRDPEVRRLEAGHRKLVLP